MNEQVGIAGLGVVGSSLKNAFEIASRPVRGLYDPYKGFPHLEPMAECSVIFVCVGTPENGGDLDRVAVWEVVSALSRLPVPNDTVIAVRSTVPPGTSAELSRVFPWLNFASTPEFLVQDDAFDTMVNPDRIVVGANDSLTHERLARILTSITKGGDVVELAPIEAELLKLCANVMLASKVAVANELHDVCAAYEVEWERIRPGIGLDPRIGESHMVVTDERGFGGACFPKDLRGLIAASVRAGHQPELLQAVEDLNKRVRGARTKSGRILSDDDFEQLAAEAEKGYDVQQLRGRDEV